MTTNFNSIPHDMYQVHIVGIKTMLSLCLLLSCCSYVLLHHVMGELEGRRNAWGYAEGGMGGVSTAIANAARSFGATICTDSVCCIKYL